MKANTNIIYFLFTVLICSSCSKNWLEAKSNQSYSTITKVQDAQALLDNLINYNQGQMRFNELGADNYYLSATNFKSRSQGDKNLYLWAATESFYPGQTTSDWDNTYKTIFNVNTVLEDIERVKDGATAQEFNNVKGQALFHRAYCYYRLTQLFCKAFDAKTAATDPGVVLRLETDVNLASQRSSVLETYNQMIADLKESEKLLPVTPLYKTRAGKMAAQFLLARIYLLQQDFVNAGKHADLVLQANNKLMDYNSDPSIKTAEVFPFSLYNDEVIFHSTLEYYRMLPHTNGIGIVDTILYKSFDAHDLRKKYFFETIAGRVAFAGSYNGDFYFFNGFATDEMYLTRAECYARDNQLDKAVADINALMSKRMETAFYVPVTVSDKQGVMDIIFKERRKELCFRGIRWSDLRRLNLESTYRVDLRRVADGQEYTLPANDRRFVYPIPASEILYSGIEQNLR